MSDAISTKTAKTNVTDTLSRYTSGLFSPIVEKCEGCERIIEAANIKYCQTYVLPETKWRLGLCNFATHVKPEIATAKTKINPLKASKRAMAGRK